MISGCYTALITPFLDEPGLLPKIDYDSLGDLIEWQLSAGVDGLVACGTSGEAATLVAEEKVELSRFVIDRVKGRVPVVVGTGSNSTFSTLEFSQKAKELGADAALVVSPYYNKPSQAGLEQHFLTVAESAGLPLIIYDIPGRAGVEIDESVMRKLSQHPSIVAVKDATGSATKAEKMASKYAKDFSILSGDDDLVFNIMRAGGAGVISASANVLPEKFVEIVRLYESGAIEASQSAQVGLNDIIKALFAETNPAPAKAALKLTGKIKTDRMRLPLVPVKSSTYENLAALLLDT